MSDTVFASNNALLTQVQLEYEEGQDYLRAKKLNQVANLILFNNLQRDDQSITSTLLPSMFNRVFSNLYSDVLQAVFVPSEDSDFKKTEAISKMQQNDYQEMCIPDLNYDWTWDACFFGEGYLETLVFNRKTKLMEPYVVNPLYLTHDPFFENVREWRYYSIWMTFSTYQLERMKAKKVTGPDFDITRISPGLEVELWDYKNRRDAARLATNVNSSSMSKNNVYQILKHFTVLTEDHPDSQGKIIPKGNRVIVWTDKNFSQEIRVERLSKYIPEDEPWPLVRKQIFREPHSSTAISVPDLIQDKHRAQSVLMNLAYLAAQDDANPIYLYDKNHVDDPTQFMSRQIGQHVAVDDLNAAVKPMQTHAAMSAALSAFLSLLGSHSSEVIGTAIIQPTAQK